MEGGAEEEVGVSRERTEKWLERETGGAAGIGQRVEEVGGGGGGLGEGAEGGGFEEEE